MVCTVATCTVYCVLWLLTQFIHVTLFPEVTMTWQRLLTLGLLLLASVSLAMPRDYSALYRKAAIFDLLFGHKDARFDMDTAHASSLVKRSPFTAFCSVGVSSWGGLCCMNAPYGGCDCFGESWTRLEFC